MLGFLFRSGCGAFVDSVVTFNSNLSATLSVGFVVVYFIRDSIMIGGPPEGIKMFKSLNPAAQFWPWDI